MAAQRRGRSQIEVIAGRAVDLLVDQLNDERLVSIDWMLAQVQEGKVDAARHLMRAALIVKPLWVLLNADDRNKVMEAISVASGFRLEVLSATVGMVLASRQELNQRSDHRAVHPKEIA